MVSLSRVVKQLLLSGLFVVACGTAGCNCNNTTNGDMEPPDGFVFDSDSGQWVPNDGGPIVVNGDGGVTIHDDGGTFTCYPTTCQGKLLACGDCVDNDGDGLIDWRDPECLGPCDNTEGPGLDPGVGGTTGNSCGVDCYFDYGNGPGNDQCVWDHRCDPLQPESICPYNQSLVGGKDCPATQVAQCESYCMPLTPNGCDCFGCCTFPQLKGTGPGGSDTYVWIGAMDSKNVSTCTFADINDRTKCPACTPVQNCLNTCETCELCLGKTTLPPECTPSTDGGTPAPDGGNYMRCPPSIQPCGLPTDPACPIGFYCITGCCQPNIP